MAAMSNNARIISRRALVEEHIRLENLHDLEGILSTFGPEARYDDEPWDDHRIGRDQVRRFYEEVLTAAPDLHIELQHCHAADTAIVVEVMITGTHLGVWRGLPGTGRLLRFPLCGIYTFDREDRLSGEKIYYDRASVLKQLGLFREPTHGLGRLLSLVNHPLTIARALGRKFLGLKLRISHPCDGLPFRENPLRARCCAQASLESQTGFKKLYQL